MFCAFSKCRSDNHGGAICVFVSNYTRIRANCFDLCKGSISSFLVWGHFQINRFVEFNLSNEYFLDADYSSLIIGTERMIMQNNNFSKSISKEISGIGIGSGENIKGMEYCQITNAMGKYFFSIQNSRSDISTRSYKSNFVNVTASVSFILIAHYISNPHFSSCIFITNSKVGLASHYNSGGLPTFNNCEFSIPYDSSLYSSISTDVNTFSVSNPNTYIFSSLDTYSCWNDNIFVSTQNFQAYSPKTLTTFILLELVPILTI